MANDDQIRVSEMPEASSQIGLWVLGVDSSNRSVKFLASLLQGPQGTPGTSPQARVDRISGGVRITVVDASGITTADLPDGAIGPTGPAGVSEVVVNIDDTSGNPSATTALNNGVLTINISGIKGQTGATGPTGPAGANGVSPTIQATEITGGHRLAITTASGTIYVDVMDGATGATGPIGPAGASAIKTRVDHTSSETSVTGLAWDTLHVWPEMASLTFTLGAVPSDGYEHQMTIIFDTPSDLTDFNLGVPSSLLWGNNINLANNLSASTRYEVNINSGSLIALYTEAALS